jgi:predicted lipid-binding transport protein (Tim44 family)
VTDRGTPGAYYGRMGRIIGAVLGAILSIWFIFTVIGWFSAVFKLFLVTGLIAAVVFIIVWLLAGRRRPG